MPNKNKIKKTKTWILHNDKIIMLQAASIYTRGDGGRWDLKTMFDIMLEIAETSLQVLGADLFKQLTQK